MKSWTSLVNEKLFISKLLLEQLDKLHDPYGHLQKGLCESAVYQLECGYRHHLRAVAENYNIRSAAEISSVNELIAALEAVGKHPAEAEEMADLEENEESWLGQLLATWRSFSRLPAAEVAGESSGPIPLLQLYPAPALNALDRAQIQSWIDGFRELVERHREVMVEW